MTTLFALALVLNALFFIPQIFKIIRQKSAKGISLITFTGLLFLQLFIVFYSMTQYDYFLTLISLLNILIYGTIVAAAFFYIYTGDKSKIKQTAELQDIINQLPAYAYWKDINGVMLGCNKNILGLFNFSSTDEYIGKTDYDLFAKEEANMLTATDQEIIRTGKAKVIEEMLTIRGTERRLYLSYKLPLTNKQNEIIGLIGTSVDITHAKQKLEDRLALLENIIAIMPEYISWKNKKGVYLGCNDNHATSAGFLSRKDILGKTDHDLPWKEHADLLREMDKEVMSTGLPQTKEELGVLANGTEITLLSHKTPLYQRGEIVGVLSISFDITDRKKLEALKIQQEVDEKNKNVMNILAGSIAHELRTPLAIININLDLLCRINKNEDASNQEEKIKKIELYSEKIRQSIRDTTQVINMILVKLRHVVSNKVELQNFKLYSISEIIEDALLIYPFKVNEAKLVHYQKTDQDFQTLGDPILTRHVLFNLIKNSLHAILEAGFGDVTVTLDLQDRKYNRIIFTNTAGGVSADLISKMFNKFETTDQTHNGAGLGLSFCKLVMHSYEGDVICDSDEEHYTKFTLIFPKVASST
jgi:two-component system aerobic respiration control sensor histidine kinase ArcB